MEDGSSSEQQDFVIVGEIISRFEKKGFHLKGEERWVCFTEQEEEVDSAENNEFFSTDEKHVQEQFQSQPSFFTELNEVLTRELSEDGYSCYTTGDDSDRDGFLFEFHEKGI
ncbi:hypothetical protein QL285_034098 [Trifolium repens]|nr:hypothetical protein QL285_034098 [Trifolium repens]